jgi:hypothetical protein
MSSSLLLVLAVLAWLAPALAVQVVTPSTNNTFGYSWAKLSLPLPPISLANESGAVNYTGYLKDERYIPITTSFTFPFYGQNYTTFILSANGVLLFGPQQNGRLSATDGSVNYSLFNITCDLPVPLDGVGQYNNKRRSFTAGFAFAWSDLDWSVMPEGRVRSKTFAAGSCPYSAKASEACLVVSLVHAPYYSNLGAASTSYLGDVTAILFESGDMSTQVRTYLNSTWGLNGTSSTNMGVVFGIQDTYQGQGFALSSNCSRLSTPGWGNKADLVQPGMSFEYFVAVPCPAGTVRSSNFRHCVSPPSSANTLEAGWLALVKAVLHVMFSSSF